MQPGTGFADQPLTGLRVARRLTRLRGLGREGWEGYLFLAPALAIFLLFLVIPTVWVFGLSLFKWDFIGDPQFVGLRNFQRLLLEDDLFHRSVYQTLYFVAGTVPTGMALSLFIAVLLNAKLPARGFFRAVLYSPYVLPVIATTVLWQWIYNADYGVMNGLLQAVHLPKLGWVRDSQWIMPAIIIYSIWHFTGYNTVIFLAGLANIPPELEEAARVDGANRWQSFWNVTWPLLSPTTYFVLFIAMIGSFKVFVQIYQFTVGTGGPDRAAETIGFYLYQEAFQHFRAGYASAISVIFFLIIILVTVSQMRFASRRVFYR
jgi:ABC-type sugar transport system permease subunit